MIKPPFSTLLDYEKYMRILEGLVTNKGEIPTDIENVTEIRLRTVQ
jgi:hypothetical protein